MHALSMSLSLQHGWVGFLSRSNRVLDNFGKFLMWRVLQGIVKAALRFAKLGNRINEISVTGYTCTSVKYTVSYMIPARNLTVVSLMC